MRDDDDDSEDVVPCPYCGTEEDCEHLLAIIDKTFNECGGGYACDRYEEFGQIIEGSFGKFLRQGERKRFKWGDKEIQELWFSAVENYSPEDGEVSLDRDVLTALIINLLEVSRGVHSGSVSDDSGPGLSSVVCVFHANNPKKVFDSALSKLKVRLRKVDHRVRS
jgi:hypothetical protein